MQGSKQGAPAFSVKTAVVLAVFAACLSILARAGGPPLFRFYESHATVPQDFAREWNQPGGGESVLPPKVRSMIALLREHGVRQFRVSEGIAHDPDSSVPQRLVEGAFPVRAAVRAKYMLMLTGELPASKCRPVDVRQEVVLADCG